MSDKIFMGVPMHKGEVSAATMVSVAQGSSLTHHVDFQLLGLSLLAKNFNMLWISAVKKRYDYFILHHSDLGVAGCLSQCNGTWVDLLIQRLNDLKLMALSAVVPIKSDNGYTSTGMETVKDDPWSLRRLTVKELDRCSIDHVNRQDLCDLFELDSYRSGALLINSGLLIMDIRDRGGIWREKKWPGFNIVDFIAWNTAGVPESYTIPEDWNFSSWCHKNNVPYAATKELIINHSGNQNYASVGGWGTDEHDGPRQQLHPNDYEKT